MATNGSGSEGARGKEFQAPQQYDLNEHESSVFLAGTIEMNKATRWQAKMVKELEDLDVAILNPRRDDWNSGWVQRESDPNFAEQVTWEMDGLDAVDVIALYFEAGTLSPICLMEMGIYAYHSPEKLVVCCPEGYWRVGNVEVLAHRKEVKLVDTYEEMVSEVRKKLMEKGA
jgi:hypothetical protein